jgi:hypothetical protein
MCLRGAPEKYIAGAALDRADIDFAVYLLRLEFMLYLPSRSVLSLGV